MIPLYEASLTFKEVFTLPTKNYISKLKDLIRADFGKEYVTFTADGRNAIYLALKSIGMDKDDEVLVPGYACQPVRVAIEPACKPVYVDIDSQTLTIDPQKIENHITEKTKAIFAIHLHGNACKIKEIVDIAKRYNLIVIEDTVQALGGKYGNKMLGSFGDFTILSFGFAKDIGCYRGGALISKKEVNFNSKPTSSFQTFLKLSINVFALKQLRRFPPAVYSPLAIRWLTPSLEYGGLLGADLDEDDRALIKHKLSDLVRLYKVAFLEVHGGMGLPQYDIEGILSMKPLHQYAVLRLSSPENVWAGMDRMVRKAVRKAERNSLECHLETTEESIQNDFYPLYLRNMKRFGTPPHPLSFFSNCLRYLPQNMKLFTVRYQGEVIAVLLGFTTGKRVHIIATASDESHWDKRPNDLAHWEFIKWSAENGYELFDLGPVRYAGQRQFKEKWGAEFFDYSYLYLSLQRNSLPTVDAYSGKAEFLSSVWRRLVPLPLTRVIGPWFRQQLGD